MSESARPEHQVGTKVVDTHGKDVGKVTDIFFDERTLQPRWVAVKVGGLFHRSQPLVPLDDTYLAEDGRLVVPFTLDTIRHAPQANSVPPTRREASIVAEHYGVADPTHN